MSNFITNSGSKDLKKRLIELIKSSEELKFLVGFFYFSGIRELYEGLKDNPNVILKVLVGLDVDRLNFGLIEFAEQENLSDEEKTDKFFESIKKSLNSENFDTKEFYEQVKFFIELIRKDRLIIRKTYDPNHSKLYIFKLEKGQIGRNTLFITGSSNLTKPGLTTQDEFNVEISDYGFEDAENYFDNLWYKPAVVVTEDKIIKERLIEVIEKETLVKDVSPFEAFCLVLKTYLDSFEQKEIGESLIKLMEENGYKPYQYQLDAVKQALAIIENNNGVIIADVVGLGKTIVACAIAKQLKKRGVIICPPGIMGDPRKKDAGWNMYKEQFGLYDWEVWSLGDLEKLQEVVKTRAKDIEIVIVDEAHRFRNQDTKDYELLKNICRNKQVVLLTATPFNNRPGDILSLLKLFIIPKKSSITLENNLVDQFKSFKGAFDRLSYITKYRNSPDNTKRNKAINYYKTFFGENNIDLKKVKARTKYLAKQIRNVIEPVTIRRNRLDLQNNPYYRDEVKELSQVVDPKEWFYELTKEQLDFYTRVIQDYFADPENGGRFKGAIYRPFEYEQGIKEEMTLEENRQFLQQRNLYDFMRRLLVKRFESSFGSFEQSIKNFERITLDCKKFIEKTGEHILDRQLIEKLADKIDILDESEIEKYLLEYEEKIKNGEYPKTHKRYKIDNFQYREEFLRDIDSDLQLFGEILKELEKLELIKNDPKTNCLIAHLKEELSQKPKKGEPKLKIVIFSEYVDTVKYLEKSLEKTFQNRLLVVAGDLPSSKINQINKNFDASYNEQDDDFDILLTSDKISEGFNLNRAGMVINYDIPWNPVRVIQRLGRINRISRKVFDELYIVNFFPTEKGAGLVKSREIAASKMFLIHNVLGEDAKIFDVDEEPTPAGLFKRIQQNPDKQEEESFYTKALKHYLQIKKEYPEIVANIDNYPPRVKVAKNYTENELLVFFKKRRLYVIGAKTNAENIEPYQASLEDVFEKIICSPDEKPQHWDTDQFWKTYDAIQSYKDFRLGPESDQSLETKARLNLDFLISNKEESLWPYKNFLRMLKEDILSFGTLPDYTLRRIAGFKVDKIDEIEQLKNELGEDYLTKEKNRQKEERKEIIIAIENKKV
jgi:superfamily II DNA or RNA helicase/HKD family nuclease